MPQHLAKSLGSIDGFLNVPFSAMLIWIRALSEVARLYYETSVLTYTFPLAAMTGILI